MKLLLLTLTFVAIAVVIIIIYALLHHGRVGEHVSANRAMRKRGIGCVQSQDRQAQNRKPIA